MKTNDVKNSFSGIFFTWQTIRPVYQIQHIHE